MAVLVFLVKVVGISLSGVMAPGPVTAMAICMGPGNRHAGALIAIGHGIVEFPLIVLITIGMATLFERTGVSIAIGIAGGAFLWRMAVGMFQSLNASAEDDIKVTRYGPIVTGIVLSASSPYFLLWWATVGLALATDACKFGIWAFAMFAVVHWLCDLIWLWALSWAGHKGSTLLGPNLQKAVLLICGIALLFFGLFFITDASVKIAAL